MKRLGKIIPAILALLAASCSRIEEGIVVSKYRGVASSSYAGLGPVLGIDVRGRDDHGKIVRRSALLTEREWNRVKIGEPFSFKGRSLLDAQIETKQETPKKPSAKTTPKKQQRVNKISKPEPVPAPAPKIPAFIARLFAHPAASPQPVPKTSPARKKKHAKKTSPVAARKKSTPPPSAAALMLRYRKVQTKALEDPEVRAAKQKIHTAANDEEQRQASEEYQHILFEKMRALDNSLKSRIDKEEAEKLGSPTPPGDQ